MVWAAGIKIYAEMVCWLKILKRPVNCHDFIGFVLTRPEWEIICSLLSILCWLQDCLSLFSSLFCCMWVNLLSAKFNIHFSQIIHFRCFSRCYPLQCPYLRWPIGWQVWVEQMGNLKGGGEAFVCVGKENKAKFVLPALVFIFIHS